MLRFVPVVGRGARALAAACYATGIGAALAIGAGFALGAGWWAPELQAAVGAGALVVYFVLATPFWTVFNMQDYLLTASSAPPSCRSRTWASRSSRSCCWSWAGCWASPGHRGLLGAGHRGHRRRDLDLPSRCCRRTSRRRSGRRRRSRCASMRGFVAADWLGSMCLTIVNFGLPLLVFAQLGADSAATFGVAWQLAYALYLVPTGMGQSLVAHSAADPVRHRRGLPQDAHQVAHAGVPAVLVLSAGSWLVLMVFGRALRADRQPAARPLGVLGHPGVREPGRDRRGPGAPAPHGPVRGDARLRR
jgi:hypothetical protein